MEAQLDLPAPNLTISVSVDILKQNKIRELKKYVRNYPLDTIKVPGILLHQG